MKHPTSGCICLYCHKIIHILNALFSLTTLSCSGGLAGRLRKINKQGATWGQRLNLLPLPDEPGGGDDDYDDTLINLLRPAEPTEELTLTFCVCSLKKLQTRYITATSWNWQFLEKKFNKYTVSNQQNWVQVDMTRADSFREFDHFEWCLQRHRCRADSSSGNSAHMCLANFWSGWVRRDKMQISSVTLPFLLTKDKIPQSISTSLLLALL